MGAIELLENSKIEGNAYLLPNVPFYAVRAKDFDQAIAALREPCVWTYDEFHDKWDTGCGDAWWFLEGGLKENRLTYCPNCAHLVKEKAK